LKYKKQVLNFLGDNHTMINSLMSREEKRIFNGDVVGIMEKEIKQQVAKEEKK